LLENAADRPCNLSSMRRPSSVDAALFLFLAESMIRKSGHRFSEKIMLKQKDRAG
jgi:hypothetical protein